MTLRHWIVYHNNKFFIVKRFPLFKRLLYGKNAVFNYDDVYYSTDFSTYYDAFELMNEIIYNNTLNKNKIYTDNIEDVL